MGSDVTGYRPVSAVAVMALVTGAVSALALVSPFFWIVPLLAIGLALAGLADVRRPGAEKAGRAAALVGLALAIGFGSQAASATATARWIGSARARAAAAAWLEAIHQDRLDDARGMCEADAREAVDKVAECGGSHVPRVIATAAGEEAGAWNVQATLGGCVVDVTLVATPSTWQGRTGERWMVVRGDVMPSAK